MPQSAPATLPTTLPTVDDAILEVKNLQTHFFLERGIVRAVNGVDFSLGRRKTLGVVGESGCGKSVTARSVMRLVQSPPGKIVGGEILLNRKGKDGAVKTTDIVKLNPKGKEMRRIRGAEIAMIFQEPMTSLNPLYTIGNQIAETVMLHQNVGKKEALDRGLEMLTRVQINDPAQRLHQHPHELSGGMRQRVMIAMALSCNPSILIADEPTTALDVTVQAQILELMRALQDEFDSAIMMITHNLGRGLAGGRFGGGDVLGQGGGVWAGARDFPQPAAPVHRRAAQIRARARAKRPRCSCRLRAWSPARWTTSLAAPSKRAAPTA